MPETNHTPIHDEAANLAGDILDEVTDQASLSRARSDMVNTTRNNSWPAILASILLGLTISLCFGLREPGPPLTNDEIRLTMLDDLSEIAYDIEAYRDIHGELPKKLPLLATASNPTINYQVLNRNHYRISLRNGEQVLIHQSNDSANIFFVEVRGIE